MTLTIDFNLEGTGWADCIVQFNETKCEIYASYLSDALGSLVVCGVAVLAGVHSISVGFDEEPGEYRWGVTSGDGNQVRVVILSFPQLWGNRPDSEGEPLIAFELTRLEFGIAVRDAASKVLAQHGEAGYKSRWVQHDFPTSSLTLLNDYISRRERDR